jgi:hypothetical protein
MVQAPPPDDNESIYNKRARENPNGPLMRWL